MYDIWSDEPDPFEPGDVVIAQHVRRVVDCVEWSDSGARVWLEGESDWFPASEMVTAV
jgi:hypothetical protein